MFFQAQGHTFLISETRVQGTVIRSSCNALYTWHAHLIRRVEQLVLLPVVAAEGGQEEHPLAPFAPHGCHDLHIRRGGSLPQHQLHLRCLHYATPVAGLLITMPISKEGSVERAHRRGCYEMKVHAWCQLKDWPRAPGGGVEIERGGTMSSLMCSKAETERRGIQSLPRAVEVQMGWSARLTTRVMRPPGGSNAQHLTLHRTHTHMS